jgi:asparagine synthase (glutamine-hydrolysing)
MTRWLAGVFDPSGRADRSRLAGALAPCHATLAQDGPLSVAYSGDASAERAPLCLLDGYLDNASELRRALGWDESSDEERLLAACWHRWGFDLPARMRGDFALLVWDQDRGEGLLARDQLGVRSMFLHEAFGALCFASEMRQLLALLTSRPGPDPVSVAHWITMSNRPGDATLYAGVRRLNPGSALLLDGQGAREVRYWAPRFIEPLSEPPAELVERARAALDRAVGLRISERGTTGVLMSGGLDSSSIAALTSIHAPGRTSAQSAVFPDHPRVDEAELIDELRAALDLPGFTAEVRAGGLLASALDSTAEWQLPLRSWGDFWALPLLRAAAATGVQVTLGGDGGDELFGAREYLLADRLRRGHPLSAFTLTRELPGAGDRPARGTRARIFRDLALAGALPYRAHDALRRLSARRGPPSWLHAPLVSEMLDADDPLAWKLLEGPRWWAEVAHGLTRGVEETGVFEHQRRRAASAGLEARHPLFDLELVELCLRLPPLATFDRYRSRPVLREAMAGLLPDAVRLRPEKALFDSLLLDCLAGADGQLARELLTSPTAKLGDFVDLYALQEVLFEKTAESERSFAWMWQVWRLLTAECWLRLEAGEDIERIVHTASAAQVSIHSVPRRSAATTPTV